MSLLVLAAHQLLREGPNPAPRGTARSSCPGPSTFTETRTPAAAALQSGDIALGFNPTGLLKTSPDGLTFAGSASESDGVVGSANWTWSLKGSA